MFAYDATEHIDSIECIKKHSQSIWLGSKMVRIFTHVWESLWKKKVIAFFIATLNILITSFTLPNSLISTKFNISHAGLFIHSLVCYLVLCAIGMVWIKFSAAIEVYLFFGFT